MAKAGVVDRLLNKRRRERYAFQRYAALIATPGDLTTGVALPASARLRASVAAVLAAPTVVLNESSGRDIGLPAGASGDVHAIGWFEQDRELTKDAAAPGVVSLYIEDSFGKVYKIAEG